jgi:hypothetical protein
MLHTCFWVALIAIIYTIRVSNAANCTSTTFNQALDATQMALSGITDNDFATGTQVQIAAQLQELFNETTANISCTVPRTGNSCSISCAVIYACNDTIISNGTTKTTSIVSNLNQTKVQEAISCGLFEILFKSKNLFQMN